MDSTMNSPNYADLGPDNYEWAYIGRQAADDPETFTQIAEAEGVPNATDYTIEVIRLGNEEAWQIALAHSGLIRSLANRFSAPGRDITRDFRDLQSAGYESAHKAAGKYFPRANTMSPGSFFYTAIRRGIIRYLDDTSTTVRLPVNVREGLRRFDRLSSHRDPATGRGVSKSRVFDILDIRDPDAQKQLLQARLISKEMGSLDEGFSPEIDNPSGNRYSQVMQSVFYEGAPDELERAYEQLRGEEIHKYIDKAGLNERQKLVLFLRFGIDPNPGGNGSKAMTLAEVGNIIGVTQSRVRQIEAAALSKLRSTLKHRDSQIS